MDIQTLCLGPIQTNCHIVSDDEGRALVIDPASEASRILRVLDDHRLTVLAYPVTHGHADHIGALAEVHRRHPAPIGMHPSDAAWAFDSVNNLAPVMDAPERPTAIERMYAENQEWTDGSWTYRVIETPGHSPGAVAFHFPREKVLFPGDTLFQGSVGRTDLPGGDPRLLTQSLRKLAALPPETRVYPGHGPPTTIGEEKRTNYFMRYGVGP